MPKPGFKVRGTALSVSPMYVSLLQIMYLYLVYQLPFFNKGNENKLLCTKLTYDILTKIDQMYVNL